MNSIYFISYSSFAGGRGGAVAVMLSSSSDSSELVDDRSLNAGASKLITVLLDEMDDMSDEESSESDCVSPSFDVKVLRCIKSC